MYWKHKVCLGEDKLEIKDELEHECKFEFEPEHVNDIMIVNYSCNQCGYDRQVETKLLHQCETTRSPGGYCL